MKKGTTISFDALFSNASLGILVTDENGIILLVNPFLLMQFDYVEDELIGFPVEKLIPARYAKKHEQYVEGYSERPKSRPMGVGMDLFGVRKDGTEFPVEVSLGSYVTDGRKILIAFVSDISKRKAAELALKQLNEELEEKVEERTRSLQQSVTQLGELVHEMEEKDAELLLALAKEKDLSELKSRFVSLASHEFRTPLSTVLSSAYLISKYTDATDHAKREKHVQRIVSSVNMLTDILNDFLSVGKIEEGKIPVRYTIFDINQHINSTLTELNLLLKAGQVVQYAHMGTTMVTLDAGLLKHIVINLVSNAIKFSPAQSTIAVSSSYANSTITLVCSDNGLGIPAGDQQHLFERFFRATNVNNIQGTGLGLHIVAKYVELMNGSIACTSELGNGTTFEITFPI